ncbi:hypothetical protein F4694_000236 [Bacillus niacini]|jgi:hypothetical protein|uniref:DUF3955 domain-containing protein n=2 Tax=Neobacillus TaxID=2675232 RepID=A0A852T6S5_9BACI|nr:MULTISPECIES: hypothetical protein [Neobacillus]MDP5196781.1 hypothetical protein [Neobacillus sp. 179.-C4.2 HS]NYE03517.1 hypothetical protein [Neobacillus niacini]
MSVLDRSPFLYFLCILAGFALLRVELTGFFAPLSPLVLLIGVIAVLLFSLVLIIHGVLCLVKRR